jgi:pSer/pThr/pTyr-binding forkhead associated (FHA) protein
VTLCAFCGRENDPASKFCIDCGKPVVAAGGARVVPVPGIAASGADGGRFSVPQTRVSSKGPVRASSNVGNGAPAGAASGGAATSPCRYCSTPVDPSLPFCPKCGGRVAEAPEARSATSDALCASCGKPVTIGVDVFCARCGARVAMSASPPSPPAGTAVFSAKATVRGPKISVLDAAGTVTRTVTLEGTEATIGRADGELKFPDDVFMSPVHAQLSWRDGQLFVRDLGSRNGTWLFTDVPYKLQDGDTVLIGSQLLRFRRLGYPGPHPPEADATRRLGSATPSADVAVLQQLRSDGSARDSCHLSPTRSVVIGRTDGDWIFPYDQTMSGRHAEVRSEDLEFIVLDLASRNGIAVAVRGEKPVHAGQRVLLGDQTLRVESI